MDEPSGMTELATRARAAGLIATYRDGAGRLQTAPETSIEAVLDALTPLPEPLRDTTSRAVPAGSPVPLPEGAWSLTLEDGTALRGTGSLPPLPVGYHRLQQGARFTHLLAHPARLPLPPRGWGVTAPLFALWEGTQAGMGAYPVLGALAEGLADHGAGFLGINPVHAGFPLDPQNFSPYAPSHRRRLNILHVETGATLPETGPLIDHAAVIPAQLAALEAAFAAFRGSPGFDDWCATQGAALQDFCLHQALSERFGPYWCNWPATYRDPKSVECAGFARETSNRLHFHAWAQWQAETQLLAAQSRARAAGMRHGLYLDLAVGTHPHGAETWAEPAAFAHGISQGAPPDLLGPSGQRWNLAPLRPDYLLATGMAPLRETLAAQLRLSGMLRIDHILGFERAFWLPEGLPGLYVQMPRDQMLACLLIEAQRNEATIIGEDLGTIPDGLRAALEAAGILGCRLAMFERDWQGDGGFLPPARYDRAALAAWGSHDTPTWAGWRAGRDLEWRARLGELDAADTALAERKTEVAGFDAVAGPALDDLHRHLATTPSVLVALQAEDLACAVEQCNLPGTIHDHPNWRRRLGLPVAALIASETTGQAARIMARAQRERER